MSILVDNPGISVQGWDSADLWEILQCRLIACAQMWGTQKPFMPRWIKAHASEEHIAQGLIDKEDIEFNELADRLANMAIYMPDDHIQ
eukprot:2018064-Karenia_brevis.AAC.1